jgi:glyoxylase-like metal-dependent hydrolase (beta-lactamase superfamily II)
MDYLLDALPAVEVLTAPNPGPKTLDGTNTALVGSEAVYVIDPGPDLPEHAQRIVERLQARGAAPAAILLTHGHPDHAPGAARLKVLLGVPVWAPEALPADQAEDAGVDSRFGHGHRFPVDGTDLIAVATPGHTPEHVAFFLDAARILFAGDTVLGRGTSVIAPPEGDMLDYMETLRRLRDLEARLIVPGHGPLISDPIAKIDQYLAHRRQRERQILDALAAGPATIPELVARIYVDVDSALHRLAEGSVEAQLIKLVREGLVVREGERFALG